MTGSGKTTFVSKVTGRSDLKIGHSLTSCALPLAVLGTGGTQTNFDLSFFD